MICQMSLSKLLKLLNCSYSLPSPQFWKLPPSPQFWGDKKIKVFQSPPELGDLGGLDPFQRRQKNLPSKLAPHCVANLKQKYSW